MSQPGEGRVGRETVGTKHKYLSKLWETPIRILPSAGISRNPIYQRPLEGYLFDLNPRVFAFYDMVNYKHRELTPSTQIIRTSFKTNM